MHRRVFGLVDCTWQVRVAAMLAFLAALLFVVLLAYLPVAIFSGAGHDDAWFWLRAQTIVAGNWLGEYNQYTLMKGVGYPLFLALNHGVGASLSFSQALLYAVACLLLGHAVFRVTGNAWFALLLLLLMLWHPMTMTWERVIRDNIYAAQTLLVIGCMLHFLFDARSRKASVAWAAMTGWMLAWLWSTREDGVWILPGVAILVLARLLQARRLDGEARRLSVGGVAMAAAFCLLLGLVATANWAKYGRFETVDLKGGGFGDALSALQSVRAGEQIAYVPVSASMRAAVYPISPTFSRLEPYLEGVGRHWTDPGCRLYAQACGDYAGGWFLWVLRDAVAETGGYESPQAANAFYRAIATEIKHACADGVIDCSAKGIGLMPAVTRAQWRELPARLRKGATMAAWSDVSGQALRSHGSKSMTGDMWRFVGSPRVRSTRGLSGRSVRGWFYAQEGTWLRIRCRSSGYAREVERRESPDIAAHFADPSAHNRRFDIDFPPASDCVLEAGSGNTYVHVVDIADLRQPRMSLLVGDGTLYVDAVGDGVDVDAVSPGAALAWKQGIDRAYGVFMPWLAMAGALAFLLAAVIALIRRTFEPLFVLACAAWALVACRIVLLSLVDISSFPALNIQYMQPAFPLLVLGAVSSLFCLGRWYRMPRSAAPE